MPESDTFHCEACGKDFLKQRSDAEALAESDRLFGTKSQKWQKWAVVCDDCFKKVMLQITS
jgi:hypothetical protein